MKLDRHSAREFADALMDVLPPGDAWDWQQGGFGDTMVLGTAQELARIEAGAQAVLDEAIEAHRPKDSGGWNISQYRRVAAAAVANVTETIPRRPLAVGGHAGDRCWGADAAAHDFPVALVKVDHLVGPLRVGSKAGDACWTERGRFVLRVRYYASVVNPAVLYAALDAFKQAHIYLWFEDITGRGGSYVPH